MAWHPFHYSAPYNWHTPRKVRIYDGEEPEWRWHATNHRIKKQKSDNYSTGIDGLLTKSDNTQDQLYVINSTLKASAMFIASPANFVADSVMLVRYGGSVDSSSSISDTFGFRPLVCLKSNTQLQKVGDTIYQIK